jgi:CDP-glucose 4,6-dehydratase
MFGDFYKGKRVFITGHTGFKGAWLSQWLLNLGAEVAGYSVNIPTKPSLYEALNLQKKLTKDTRADVLDFNKLKKETDSFKPDFVFHLAAQSLVGTSYDLPKQTFDTNVGGTVNVLEIIRESTTIQGAVIVTSDKCYENSGEEHAYSEGDRLGGRDPYSASKACAELVATSYSASYLDYKEGPQICTVRAGNVIGGGDWAKDRIVPDCVRAWTKGESVHLRNPDFIRPWQHVLEPLSGYLWLGSRLMTNPEGHVGEPFNFGPAEDCTKSVMDLVKEMQKSWPHTQFNTAPPYPGSEANENKSGPKKEMTMLMLNCDKAKEVLGWTPTLTFAEAVKMTTHWYSAFYTKEVDITKHTNESIDEYVAKARTANQMWVD